MNNKEKLYGNNDVLYISFMFFWVLYVTSSFANIFSNFISLMILIFIGVTTILFKCKTIKVSTKQFVLSLIVFINICFTSFIMHDSIKQILIWIITFFTVFSFVCSFSIKNILYGYVKLIYFLCVSSLVMWSIYLLAPQLIEWLPVVTNESGISAYSVLFASIYKAPNVEIARNQGMFWEPGAFQVFINIALIITLFFLNDNFKRGKFICIFLFTIITTFSTGGYIVAALIFLCYLINYFVKNKGHVDKSLKLLFICVSGIAAFFIFYENISDDLRYQLFGKVYKFFSDDNVSNVSSTGTRVNSFLISIRSFFDSPFWGNGVAGMSQISTSYGGDIGTCTPVNWFAYYGFITGCVINIGFLLFSGKCKNNKIIAIFIFLILLLSLSSENLWRNPIVLLISFLGYSDEASKYEYFSD